MVGTRGSGEKLSGGQEQGVLVREAVGRAEGAAVLQRVFGGRKTTPFTWLLSDLLFRRFFDVKVIKVVNVFSLAVFKLISKTVERNVKSTKILFCIYLSIYVVSFKL